MEAFRDDRYFDPISVTMAAFFLLPMVPLWFLLPPGSTIKTPIKVLAISTLGAPLFGGMPGMLLGWIIRSGS